MIAVPMPPRTLGISEWPTYVRWPGRDTRLRPEMAERRSESEYLSVIRIRLPG
jgi:hypothetical protein